jgi:glycosyltransferase involved in cell wall biosynthesis
LKISIVLTSYNHEAFITEALYGILFQLSPPDEVIISDDCSTDNTQGLIRKFINDNNVGHWTILYQSNNLGITKNLAAALRHATGDIIIGMAGDDISLPSRCHITRQLFRNNTNVLAIATSGDAISPEGNYLYTISHKSLGLYKFSLDIIKSGCTRVFPVGMAFKREIFINFQHIHCHIRNEDDYLVFQALIRTGIFISHDKTFLYRIHDKSASSWIRDFSIHNYTVGFMNDIDNRISHFQLWKESLLSYHPRLSSQHTQAIFLLDKKIKAYNLFYQSLYSRLTQTLVLLLSPDCPLCLREIILLIVGPRIYSFIRMSLKTTLT